MGRERLVDRNMGCQTIIIFQVSNSLTTQSDCSDFWVSFDNNIIKVNNCITNRSAGSFIVTRYRNNKLC